MIFYCDYDTLNLNFHAKNGQNSTFSIIVDSVLTQNHDFWRENSNYPGFIDSHKLSRVKVPLTPQRAMAFLGLRRKVLQQMKHNEKYEEIAEVLNQAVADQTKVWMENGGKMCKKHSELYYEITGLHVFHEAYQYLCSVFITSTSKLKMPRQDSMDCEDSINEETDKEESNTDEEYDKLEESAKNLALNFEEDVTSTLPLPSPSHEKTKNNKSPRRNRSSERNGTIMKPPQPPNSSRRNSVPSNINKAIANSLKKKPRPNSKYFANPPMLQDEQPPLDAEMLCLMHEMRQKGQL